MDEMAGMLFRINLKEDCPEQGNPPFLFFILFSCKYTSENSVNKHIFWFGFESIRLTVLYKKWANRPVPNWAMVRNQLSMDTGMQARIMKYKKY